VSALAALVGGRVVGDANRRIIGVADLKSACADRIGFVRSAKYVGAALESGAGALITSEELESTSTQIVVEDVQLAYAKVALHFHPVSRAERTAIHPTAVIDAAAELEEPVEIGPHAVIGKARIGAGTIIKSGVAIGDGCQLGRACMLFPQVVLYQDVCLRDRVVVHAGTVIGADGFGYSQPGQQFVKVPQIGSVTLGEDVEIGAGCTIDRGAIWETSIGARTKIDNLCHIAHNVVCGVDCGIAAATFVAGSTRMGDRVMLGGHVVVAGHLEIGDDVRIGGNSCLLQSVEKPGEYMGHPLVEKRQFARLIVAQRDLLDLRAEVGELKRQLGKALGTGES